MGVDLELTEADLANVRVLIEPRPFMEPLLAAHLLLQRTPDPFLRSWRESTVHRLGPAAAPVLQTMLSPVVMVSDLLSGHEPAADLAGLLDAFRSTPAAQVRARVDHLAHHVRPGPWTGLRDGQARDMAQIERAVDLFATAAVVPLAAPVASLVAAAGRRLATVLATQGPDAALAALHPSVRWNPPILTFDRMLTCPPGCVHHASTRSHMSSSAFASGGKGVRLVPVAFAHGVTFSTDDDLDSDRPTRIEFPAAPDWSFTVTTAPPAAARLGPLVGLTRACVLEALAAGPMSTTALARRVGVAVSSASEHAAVLRTAGLLRTTRRTHSVLHELTDLGRALLEDAL